MSGSGKKTSLFHSDASATKNAIIGLGCGVAYGITSPLVGHPIDTIKTKMQAQKGYATGGMFATAKTVFVKDGLKGFYRGLLPPLFGSVFFRSVQFAAYGAAHAAKPDGPDGSLTKAWRTEIPFTGGLEVRVLGAGLFAASVRATFESPLEFMKVRRQTGSNWRIYGTWQESLRHPLKEFSHIFTGFGITWMRTAGLMTSFFVMVDYGYRYVPDLFNAPLIGPFMKGGVCATMSWWLIWPFETMKSKVQAGDEGGSAWKRAIAQIRQKGFLSLYRGILPGSIRSFVANGTSMLVFTYCQKLQQSED
mmetsp:Transcript_5004/g.10779  ORF Transcript_5004/g.10779 Transcript_5004/m.10779 type:complete len:306 (-) Transcript_5004:2125-3042(-)